LYRNTVTKTN